MKCFPVVILLLLFSFACSNNVEKERPTAEKASQEEAASHEEYAVEVIPSAEGTFGYHILKNNKPFIRQLHIPGVAGNKGFSSKEEARKVGELVRDKLEKGSFPPTVTKAELDSLQISL